MTHAIDNMVSSLKILLVDDHALLRESLGQMLESEEHFLVVGAAADAEQAIEIALDMAPDIILMDIDMPGVICFDAARRINSLCPKTRIIFLSAFFHDRYIQQALDVKARGYLTKSEPLSKIIHAIKQVAAGRVYFSDQVRSSIIVDTVGVRLANADCTRASLLSSREVEVLRYVAQGLSKKDIARTMHISVKTVEGHTHKVMSKLDIHDRVELARYAIREGLAEA